MARVHDRITTYGFGTSNAVRVKVAEASEAGSRFSVTGGPDGEVALRVTLPGRRNVLNATAAFLAARQLGCPVPAIAAALGGFAGRIVEVNEITLPAHQWELVYEWPAR